MYVFFLPRACMGEKKLLLSRSEFWMNSVTVSLRCKSFCDVDLFCQLEMIAIIISMSIWNCRRVFVSAKNELFINFLESTIYARHCTIHSAGIKLHHIKSFKPFSSAAQWKTFEIQYTVLKMYTMHTT